MRVLHCPSCVGGNAWALSQAERRLGIDSQVMITEKSIFSDNYDIFLNVSGNALRKKKIIWDFYKEAVQSYDVFHFNFGMSLVSSRFRLLDMIDLPYLKKAGKGIAVTYQGSDARQANYCLENYNITYFTGEDAANNRARDMLKKRRIGMFGKYADLIYSTNPDLLNVLPERAKFRPYTKIDLHEWHADDFSDYNKNELVIAHAPSNRKVKGTDSIIAAIDKLKEEGYPVRLILIENVPNKQVMNIYKQADLLIDQLLVGWYGGVSVEFMALGKPVIVYLRESDLSYLPDDMRNDLPFIRADPTSIYSVLKQCIQNRQILGERACLSRKFVEKWHDSSKIAKQIIKDYELVLGKIHT